MSGSPIGPFQIPGQSAAASQPKRARLEQASSALVAESVKQDGGECFALAPFKKKNINVEISSVSAKK